MYIKETINSCLRTCANIISNHNLHACWLAMANTKEVNTFQKHVNAVLESAKRRFDHSLYGGEAQAIEAAKQFLSQGKVFMTRFDSIGRQPAERKEWITKTFGADALTSKALAVQRSILVDRLCQQKVPNVEACIMQAAIRATPGLEKTESICLTYDQGSEMYKAVLSSENENMTKMFKEIKDAKNWLLNMGKSSEAWILRKNNVLMKRLRIYIYTYIYIVYFLLVLYIVL